MSDRRKVSLQTLGRVYEHLALFKCPTEDKFGVMEAAEYLLYMFKSRYSEKGEISFGTLLSSAWSRNENIKRQLAAQGGK